MGLIVEFKFGAQLGLVVGYLKVFILFESNWQPSGQSWSG